MNYIGGIQGMNFTPIANYNNLIKNNNSFDVDTNNMSFENVLSQQQAAMESPIKVQGGIEKTNFDDILAQTAVERSDNSSTGSFMKSFSNSISGGLNSVNSNVKAAEKAQEALAMGEDVSVHDVMIASEKATLSLQMAMQLRNKLMSAYTEINNVKV